jgi:hypothetical protein
VRDLWFDHLWFEFSDDAAALLKAGFSAEDVEKRRADKRAGKELARKAFEDGDAGRLVAAVPDYDALIFVRVNSKVLKERGIYEASLLEALVAAKENNHSWPIADLKRMIDDGDRAKLRAAGDPLLHSGLFTLYRGVAGKPRVRRVRGLSWTATFEKAIWFASRPMARNLPDPAVYKAEVEARHVLAYLGSRRSEDEYIVMLPRSVKVERTNWTP